MKKLLKAIIAASVVTISLTISASAVSFNHCADTLKDLGLFQGGADGYELDQAPNRGQAAAMIVRLMGKETEAKTLTYTAPFTDLDNWEKPYVQYLYQNNLINGTSETTFNPNGKCDATMYSVLLMRTLGFNEKDGDFTYAEALNKAEELGIIDSSDYNTNKFLRDDLVALSYTTLSIEPKDKTADTLLDKLVEEGVVDQKKAASLQELFKNYEEYCNFNESYSKATKMSADVKMDADAKLNGTDMMSMTMKMALAADMNFDDLNQSKIAANAKTNISIQGQDTPTTNLNYYYTDGYYYVDMDGTKYKIPMDFSDVQGMLQSNEFQSQPISMIKNLTVKNSGGSTVYTIEYAPGALNKMINSIFSSMNLSDEDTGNIQFGDTTCTVTVKDNAITDINADINMTLTIEDENMEMSITADYSNIKTDDSVTVNLPNDLSAYTTDLT